MFTLKILNIWLGFKGKYTNIYSTYPIQQRPPNLFTLWPGGCFFHVPAAWQAFFHLVHVRVHTPIHPPFSLMFPSCPTGKWLPRGKCVRQTQACTFLKLSGPCSLVLTGLQFNSWGVLVYNTNTHFTEVKLSHC